ncbi:Zinc finger, C3HC4 type (RING finger) [Geosmithia morbida]|uniref:Zinc finger, C3HC4 type (RING finger) n=1 Tax=Geosmithia morbida TaxID=1094350 RepID=A0A9P4YUH6_9HYPO|nr:Zinc finger, C3HC4 type (RING finger) [Geosmithia morbida]KAF4122290.1 Zinc finger, C3HC4 type (RING finger) [Geosmithia morbida]
MASGGPVMALDALQASQQPPPRRHLDAPRRCFICLTDQDASDAPDSWVDPCPCTLEAHQDCILSWVTDCERSGKPLKCPVCKSPISLEGPWDPVVSLAEAVSARFTRASPLFLFTGVSLGIQFSSQMYGAMAMWLFAGGDALIDFMLGSEVLDRRGLPVRSLKMSRVGSAIVLMNIAPTLLISQLMPRLGNRIFVPMASMYGIYHVMRDEHFASWPPSPQLAIAVFPYIRSVYWNLWREFVQPYEIRLNRRILGLPVVEPQGGDVDQRNLRAERNAEGGVVGFLQSILDALGPEEEEEGGGGDGQNIRVGRGNGAGPDGQRADHEELILDLELVIGNDEDEDAQDGAQQQPAAPAPQVPPHQDQVRRQEGPEHGHEVPPAPPANRPGLGTILSNVSNALVSALIIPGISFAMGEALRLMLPRSWVSSSSSGSLPTSSRVWARQKPGLLQQQWGRSLVGGCLYVVMRDVIRLYAKHRKVAAMENRRVRNVDRPRRHVDRE